MKSLFLWRFVWAGSKETPFLEGVAARVDGGRASVRVVPFILLLVDAGSSSEGSRTAVGPDGGHAVLDHGGHALQVEPKPGEGFVGATLVGLSGVDGVAFV